MELDLRSIPRITVRPQQISTVFSNLVQNTVEGLTGAALVWLTTCQAGPQVQIVVRDDGRDISAQELASIFDPSFKVKSGRVATGNWGLFSCLQIIGEHGGEIEIQSAPGHGDYSVGNLALCGECIGEFEDCSAEMISANGVGSRRSKIDS